MTAHAKSQQATAPRQWLGFSLATWLFVAAMCSLPVVGYLAMSTHAEKEALRDANQFSRVISLMRSYYNGSVTQRILANPGQPTTLSENYHQIPGAIPIPATLSIELGDLIRERKIDDGFSMAFVSDAPFTTRKRDPLDSFQSEALNAFRRDPQKREVWQVVPNAQGGKEVRLAIPVRMEAGCVACHNAHPASPIRTWSVGDIRGLQDVSVPVQLAEQSEDSYRFVLFLLFFIGATVYALAEHRRSNVRLNNVNAQLLRSQSDLEDSESQLKFQVTELINLTTVLDKAPFGIAFTDPSVPHRPVVYVNEAFTRLTGYSSSELIGTNRVLFPGPSTHRDALTKIQEAIAQERAAEVEVVFHRKDGQPYWNRLLTFPSFDSHGVLLSTVVCYTDISVLKAAEDERHQMAAELQESLKLESMGLTIAGIAHDLNTPMGVAMTATTHLQRQLLKLSTLAQQTPLEPDAIKRSAGGLQTSLGLILNNLDKAAALVRSFKQTSADASRHEWRTVELKPYLESLLLSVSPLLKRAQCRLELVCPEALHLHTEPGSLMQVITNLLINATVHAFDDVTDRCIWLTVTEHAENVQLVVRDNGRGMTEEALNKVFTPFFTTRRQSGGSGLGLFSSRRAVEQILGGRISVDSQRDAGARFTVQLPRQTPTRMRSRTLPLHTGTTP